MTKTEFESVVRKNQKMVYGIASSFFHNDAIAEDVAQDVFLNLYRHRDTVQIGAHCVSWLRRSTIHRCIDVLRRASFRQEIQVENLPEIPANIAEADPLLHEHLRRLVASLPESPRAVFVLRFGEDMDVEDISKTLQMPVRTVWSHLQRGTALIRAKSERYRKEMENESIRTRSS